MKTHDETSISRGVIVMGVTLLMVTALAGVLALTVTYVQRQAAEIELMKCSAPEASK